MKKSFNILTAVKLLLVVIIAVLGYFLYSVLNENITAQEQIQVRTTAVIERSKLLKELVAMYQEANQTYPKSTDEIVEFAKNGFLIKQTEKYDPNNLGKFKEPVVGTDTVWIEKSYYHLAKEAKAEDPNWTNIISDTIYARKTILKELSDKQVEELCVIPYSNEEYRVQFLEKISDGDTLHHFRCHAPYLSFLDSKEHNQQFWNFIEEKFNYEVKNNENISEDTKKRMNADGAYKAITSEKYSIGTTPETRIVIDIEYFGITFGSLEKVTLDGNWEDPRAKK